MPDPKARSPRTVELFVAECLARARTQLIISLDCLSSEPLLLPSGVLKHFEQYEEITRISTELDAIAKELVHD